MDEVLQTDLISPELAHWCQQKIPVPVRYAFVAGSGIGSVIERWETLAEWNYEEVPAALQGNVPGHARVLKLVTINGIHVLCFCGRFHVYEGHSPFEVTWPVRVAAASGASVVILGCAAGAIDPAYTPGQVVVIQDHINLTGRNPLIGLRGRSGPLFVDLSCAYDPQLRRLMHRAGLETGLGPLSEGVYAAVVGPAYETPAEIRAMERLGAGLVGMSLIHEVIMARALRMRVAAFAVVTNMAAGLSHDPLSHDEVLSRVRSIEPHLHRWLTRFLELSSASRF